MPQCLEQYYICGIGEVKRSGSGIFTHGYSYSSVFMPGYEVCGKSPGLSSEEYKVSVLKGGGGIYLSASGSGKPQPFMSVFFHERFEAFVTLKIYIRPVVQSRSLLMFLIYSESQRVFELQLRICSCAGPGYITCIWRYFRLDEHYIKAHLSLLIQNSSFFKRALCILPQ